MWSPCFFGISCEWKLFSISTLYMLLLDRNYFVVPQRRLKQMRHALLSGLCALFLVVGFAGQAPAQADSNMLQAIVADHQLPEGSYQVAFWSPPGGGDMTATIQVAALDSDQVRGLAAGNQPSRMKQMAATGLKLGLTAAETYAIYNVAISTIATGEPVTATALTALTAVFFFVVNDGVAEWIVGEPPAV